MKDGILKALGLRNPGGRPEGIREIPVDLIEANPYQPRGNLKSDDLEELAASIREHGVIQPILVRPAGSRFELVAGERRWRASRLVGLRSVPAIVRELSDHDAALLALVENLQREDLNALEEAEAYQRILDQFQITQDELARKVGRSQSAVANKLRLLKLPEETRMAISREIITERHARCLLRLQDPEDHRRVIEEIQSKELTVRETEELVAAIAEGRGNGGEGAGSSEGERGRRMLGVIKDLRIFLNSFRQAVRALRSSGIEAEITEEDRGEYIEISVRVKKHRG